MNSAAQREIEERLRKLAIHLTWTGLNNKARHGTAFFVTSGGLALTAFHNIEETLAVDPCANIQGVWQGKTLGLRWKLPDQEHRQWQQEHDIAVLEAEQRPEGIAPLEVGYLDPALDHAQRGEHWQNSHVLVAGFAHGNGYGLGSGSGHIDLANPLETVPVRERRQESALKFGTSLVENGREQGPGLSGSPVYSTADGAIVGITVATLSKFYATELWPIHQQWEASGGFLKRIPRRTRGETRQPRGRASLAVGLAGLALLGWMWWRQTRHEVPAQLSAQVLRLDTGASGPINDGASFKVGEKVRFRFLAPKDGHLYVIDQEIVSGNPGDPLIIFPTLRTGADRNLVKAGAEVDFPSQDESPPYVEAAAPDEPGYEGELLTLLIFPQALPVALKETPVPLEPALFSLDGTRPRSFIHPLAPPADAIAVRRIRLKVGK